ncbi:MSMEG_0567/Sll0786 family nitrogen starvation N-acetyltransferase [Methylomonas koyamae]|uniref:MSMEG_0567/Sll0786 family nitrogen starvation N-acetyltransferase n=1 Tax=Methylomonas koyamae TaxID=702114 RepID=UPI00287335C7|nr:MSMEG_0567/Sll0786 family nitrogen starvation N-acetyltransferase [Methylomonas koyamae]WNB74770.1 GNAT family N-acetyltransferase [Methylomonas koyamae]
MWSDDFKPYFANEYLIKFVTQDWEREQMLALRQAVFCEEQGIFAGDDLDDIDKVATPIVAIACLAGMPDRVVGTVRIHQEKLGVWWGSRLAVDRDYRKQGSLGAALIKLAVTSAHAQGCNTFLAQVQARNQLLFRRLHWRSLKEIEVHGRPHYLMQADLDSYPPYADGATGFVATSRIAA